MIAVGETLPEFALSDQSGIVINSVDLVGTPLVLFFYPKANTPGCTTEACAFRDLSSSFEALNTKVIGVSADTVKRQSNWTTKYDLNMPLLADTDRTLIEGLGVWQEKKNYGKTYMGIVRTTVLFNAAGRVEKVWSPVRVKGHVDAVLQAVTAMVQS